MESITRVDERLWEKGEQRRVITALHEC